MSYTLAMAAKATGLNRSTILRAIKSGQVTGTKDQFGEWRGEPIELRHLGGDLILSGRTFQVLKLQLDLIPPVRWAHQARAHAMQRQQLHLFR
jgi:hypothetical protein